MHCDKMSMNWPGCNAKHVNQWLISMNITFYCVHFPEMSWAVIKNLNVGQFIIFLLHHPQNIQKWQLWMQAISSYADCYNLL